jgi:hypothetical protein
MQTNRFQIILLVRELPSGLPSQFAFNSIPSLEKQVVDVDGDDILQNFTTKELQMMNGTVLWREPRESDSLLLQMLIGQRHSLYWTIHVLLVTIYHYEDQIYILCHVILKIGYAKFFILIF